VPLTDTKRALSTLRRQSTEIAALSRRVRFDSPDSGSDDAMNRLLWRLAKGKTTAYPAALAGARDEEAEEDEKASVSAH
jgi:hypothetical protein